MGNFWSSAVMLGAVLTVLGVGGSGDLATAAKLKPRFVDNGGGTVTDNQTGLMWEKKTDDNVDATYMWPSTANAPDGNLFTRFLATMNCEVSPDGTCGLAGHYDWRIPNIAELRTIVDTSVAGCGSGAACIDPIFGPPAAYAYWSSSSVGLPGNAWFVNFDGGSVSTSGKTSTLLSARAVRGGS